MTLYDQTPVLTLSNVTVNILKESDIFTERGSNFLTLQASDANNQTVVQCNDAGFDPAHSSARIQVITIGIVSL